MFRIESSNYSGMYVRVSNGESEHKLSGVLAIQQFVQFGLVPQIPLGGGTLTLSGRAFGDVTADYQADPTHPSPSSGGDRIPMLGLKSRIENLQDVEYSHLDNDGENRKPYPKNKRCGDGFLTRPHIGKPTLPKQRLNSSMEPKTTRLSTQRREYMIPEGFHLPGWELIRLVSHQIQMLHSRFLSLFDSIGAVLWRANQTHAVAQLG